MDCPYRQPDPWERRFAERLGAIIAAPLHCINRQESGAVRLFVGLPVFIVTALTLPVIAVALWPFFYTVTKWRRWRRRAARREHRHD